MFYYGDLQHGFIRDFKLDSFFYGQPVSSLSSSSYQAIIIVFVAIVIVSSWSKLLATWCRCVRINDLHSIWIIMLKLCFFLILIPCPVMPSLIIVCPALLCSFLFFLFHSKHALTHHMRFGQRYFHITKQSKSWMNDFVEHSYLRICGLS